MPENATYPQRQPASTPNAPAASRDVIPASCTELADGSVVFPPFAILDECEFFDKEHNQQVVMTPERLQKIAQRISERIARTGDAPPIIPGHTMQGLPEEKQPRIIGKAINPIVRDFVNPVTKQPVFDEKLGRIKKALYVTPIAEPGEFHTFKKLRRGRSVELWLDPEGDDIDPIALLGANTPRRDLGPHQFNLANSPRGFYRFSRLNSSQSVHFEISTEDEGDDMATDTPPADSGVGNGTGSGDGMSGKAQEMEAMLESSAIGKRLVAMLDNMDVYMPMLQQMHDMYDQSGQPGQDMPQGGPSADGAAQMQPGQPPMPAGGVGAPQGQDDDLFAAPDAGHQGQPTAMGSAGACSPGGPMNQRMPNHQMGSMGVPPAEPRHMPNAQMGRDQDARIQLARTQSDLNLAIRMIGELQAKNLSQEVEQQLRAIEPEFDFDYAEEFGNMMKFQKPEERAAHIQRIVTRFRRKQDTPPGAGSFPVPTGAIQLSRSGGVMTPEQMQTEFGRMQLARQRQAQQAAQEATPGVPMPMTEEQIQQFAAQVHATAPGQPVKFQGPVGSTGFGDVSQLMQQFMRQNQQSQQPNGVAVNGTAVR